MTASGNCPPVVARWREWEGDGLQHLVLRQMSGKTIAEGAVLASEEGERFAARFRITCDEAWRTLRLEAQVIGDDRRIDLTGDGAGLWTDGAGRRLPHLDGAIDVDLPLTPFTNTLPICRLKLEAGQSADIDVVYVRLPQFTVVTDPQRYVCLEPLRRFRYEFRDSEFVREIEVDSDGLIINYPGLFRRVL